MSPLSADDPASATTLAAIREREQAATEGPWLADVLVDADNRPVVLLPDPDDDDAALILFAADAPVASEGDAEFIAHAREDIPRLVAAIEAALKPHQPGRVTIYGNLCKLHENHRHFSITRTEADDVRACPDCAATVYPSCTGCGPHVSADACPVREAITTALAGTGKEGSDE